MNIIRFFLLALSCLAATSSALGQTFCANCGDCMHVRRQGTPPPGKPRVIPHTDARAGFPRCLSAHAAPPRPAAIRGYYVGGGLAQGGGSRCAYEGTWGWDDTGRLHHQPRVTLGWGHGRRHQGGVGAYETDGPQVPDVPAGLASRLRRKPVGDEAH